MAIAIKRRQTFSTNKIAYLEDYKPSTITSDWRSKISSEIRDLRKGLGDYQIDGELSLSMLNNGEELIAAMPATILSPVLGINGDGTLLIEWAKKETDQSLTMFSVILNNEEIVFSLMHLGNIKAYGVMNFSSESLDILRSRLAKYFENSFNSSRNAI